MLRPLHLDYSDNPLLKRVAQPENGLTLPQSILAGCAITVGILVVLAMLSMSGLRDILTVFQIVAAVTAPIFASILMLSSATFTLGEIQSEAFELVRLTNISNESLVWGLCGGMIYRLRYTIFGFAWAVGLALPLVILRLRELAKPVPAIYPPPDLSEPLWPLIPLFAGIVFIGGLGVGLMLVSGGVVMALRLRSISIAAMMTFVTTGIPIIFLFLVWLTFVSGPDHGLGVYISLVLFPIPYVIAWILSRRWETAITHHIIFSGFLPMFIFAYFLSTVLHDYGTGYAKQLDKIVFWILNITLAGLLLYGVYKNWKQTWAVNLLILFIWQVMVGGILVRGEARSDISVTAANVVVWLFCYSFVIAPYAGVLITLNRVQRTIPRFLE